VEVTFGGTGNCFRNGQPMHRDRAPHGATGTVTSRILILLSDSGLSAVEVGDRVLQPL